MSGSTIGIVVAGLGRAGRARVRDLTEKDFGDAKLIGAVSRHKPEDVQVPLLTWEDALSRDDVNAVIIATENDTHDEYIKKCLEAGKHVLVEYPLVLSFQRGKQLIELAEQNGLILQEEDIALYLPQQKELAESLKSKPPVIETAMNFTATFADNLWICDLSRAGFPCFSGLSRIHIVYNLFGELTVKEAKLTQESDRIHMTTTLLTKNNRPITWSEDRGKDMSRSLKMVFKLEDGSEINYPSSPPSSHHGGPPAGAQPPTAAGGPTRGPPKGLFAADLVYFLSKLRKEAKEEDIAKEKARVLHCLQLAEEIEKMARASS